MKAPIFTGSAVAIVTPFDADNRVNYAKLAELIDMQIAGGTSAIVVCGTTGESAAQTLEEHAETVSQCIKLVNKRVPVIAGAGSNDTMAAYDLAKHAAHEGADGLLLVTPYYNKCTQRGLIKHYEYIADRVNLPMLLYNVPVRTGVNISVDTYAVLAKHPNIVGTKEASGDLDKAAAAIIATQGEDFHVWSGEDGLAVPLMSLGAVGLISVLANIAPKATADICRFALNGDFAAARDLQLRYFPLIKALFSEVNPIPVKTAMNEMGLNVGALRLPLCEMDEANLVKLRKEMSAVGLTVDN